MCHSFGYLIKFSTPNEAHLNLSARTLVQRVLRAVPKILGRPPLSTIQH